MELGKSGYSAQVATYLRNMDYAKAYSLGKEFAQRFPDDMTAHFLLSQAAFWMKQYDEAALEASRAFNKASNDEDMLACAILRGSACYELGRYTEGFKVLKTMENREKTETLERLLFLFSIAMDNGKEAAAHLNELHKLNKRAAEDLAVRYLK